MFSYITKYITAIILALIVLINSIGNFFGIGDIIETEPSETTSVTEESSTMPITTKRHATTTTVPEETTAMPVEDVNGLLYNNDGDFYYIDDNYVCKNGTKYEEIYDAFPVKPTFRDSFRIFFTYEGKDWLIQLQKGQYGWLLVGGEAAVFTAPEGTGYEAEKYTRADSDDWLNMEFDFYWSENNNGHYRKAASREYGKNWLLTGFSKGQITKYTSPLTELKSKIRITFKSEEMAEIFAEELKNSSFMHAASNTTLLNDSYYRDGADVYILWSEGETQLKYSFDVVVPATSEPATLPPATEEPSIAVTTTRPTETTIPAPLPSVTLPSTGG